MKRFTTLYRTLDETTRTNDKVRSMVEYFRSAPPEDSAWAIYFLSGRKPKQIIPYRKLRDWAAEAAGIADWLFDESYEVVGDFAETMALVLPAGTPDDGSSLAAWVEQRLLPLRGAEEERQKAALTAAWSELDADQRFVLHKLITGAFRVGVSQRLVTRALAEHSGLDVQTIAHRMMGEWEPTAQFVQKLLAADEGEADRSRPYPFCLAHPLDDAPETLGPTDQWQAEWKWDGIRAQLIRRRGEVYIWSRGEELITDRFPEVRDALLQLTRDVVLDGEIVGYKDGAVLPFTALQKRIGRKRVGPKLLAEVPVVCLAFDLLEADGEDLRDRPLDERRRQLERCLVANEPVGEWLRAATRIIAKSWDELAAFRAASRAHQAEGLMLKRCDSEYGVGRLRGGWWKWKIEPYTVDAVLTYAQRGTGRRASLYTDYTFGVWDDDRLVTFAKAYSGLTHDEIREVDAFVRANTVERFGPVRGVKPELVFEIAFENIQQSKRHKSGIAVRFPRIVRWRRDKTIEDADSLDQIKQLAATP